MKKLIVPMIILCLFTSVYARSLKGIGGYGRIKNTFVDFMPKLFSVFKPLGIIGDNNAGIIDSRVCNNFQYQCTSQNEFNQGDTGYLYFEIETWTCSNPPCEEGCFFRIARPHPTPNDPSSLTDPSFTWDDVDCDAEVYSSWWYAYPISMSGDIQAGSNTLYIDVYNCCKGQCLYDAWHTKIKYDFTVVSSCIPDKNMDGTCYYNMQTQVSCPNCVIPVSPGNNPTGVIWTGSQQSIDTAVADYKDKINSIWHYDGCEWYVWSSDAPSTLTEFKTNWCYTFGTNEEINWGTGTTTLPPYCDYDGVCEPELGETIQDCPDCAYEMMPIVAAIILIALVCVSVGLGIHTYKRKKK